MAEDLFAMGGGGWAREDCVAALEGAGGSVEIAMELLMGGFTRAVAGVSQPVEGGARGSSAAVAGRTDGVYSAEALGAGLWKIVEADAHGQYPFTYVIMAGASPTRCVVIDTGCGTGDYKAFLDGHINTAGLPYFVICTHVHFDHVGGAHSFGPEAQIAMSAAAQAFTNNYELTSLGAAHGCPVKPFTVSHWLAHGERVPLCPAVSAAAGPTAMEELQVLHIPGHTPDHIALWWEGEAVLFVGDHIYPWTAVDISCLGHSLPSYIVSTELLL